MHVVGGTIEGVDDPAVGGGGWRGGFFFGEDLVLRIELLDLADNFSFGEEVGFGDQFSGAFELDISSIDFVVVGHEDFAGLLGQFFGKF